MRGHQRVGQRHRHRIVGGERRLQAERRQRPGQPLRRIALLGIGGSAHLLEGESAEAALQDGHPHTVLRLVQSDDPVHHSSFQ